MEIHRVYVEAESLFITASSLFYFFTVCSNFFLTSPWWAATNQISETLCPILGPAVLTSLITTL